MQCGGVRVYKLNEIDDLEIDGLEKAETKKFIKKLERALQIDHVS